MKKVLIYGWATPDADETSQLGMATWDGSKAKVQGDDRVHKLLSDSIYVNLLGLVGEKERGERYLTLKDNPELYLAYLHRALLGRRWAASPLIEEGNGKPKTKEFRESEHPRGQPENAGEFAPVAGSPANRLPKEKPEEKVDEEKLKKDTQRFEELKNKWSQINNELLANIHTPDSPEAEWQLEELKKICKEWSRLDIDRGGWESVGKPGGPRDVLIVGGGPGGLSAGINAGMEGLDAMVVDSAPELGGQAKYSSRIENLPGYPVGVAGNTLARNMCSQCARYGTEMQTGVRVEGITYDKETGLKTVKLSNGKEVQARAVVLATGLEFRKMTFPGSDSDRIIVGDGETLMNKGKGKPVVVIGGSNGAAQAALGAMRKAKSVVVLSRSPIEKSMSATQVTGLKNSPGVTILENDEIASYDQEKETLTTKKGKEIPAAYVGLFIGQQPNLKWLPKEIKLDETQGLAEVNSRYETTMPGVYAVGDNRADGIKRVGGAMGEGQATIAHVFKYFQKMRDEAAHAGTKKAWLWSWTKAAGAKRRPIKKTKKWHKEWDATIDAAFALDERYPYFAQMGEEEPPQEIKAKSITKDKPSYFADCPRDKLGHCLPSGQAGDAAEKLPAVARLEEAAADYKEHGTKAKAFKAWFGDWEKDPTAASKVTKDGEPAETNGVAKVYHGTGTKFQAFSKGKEGTGMVGKGIYFAENREIAENYAESRNDEHPVIVEAYLNIRRPFYFDGGVSKGSFERIIQAARGYATETGVRFDEDGFMDSTEKKRDGFSVWTSLRDSFGGEGSFWEKEGAKHVNDVLARAGYDGISHKSGDPMGTPPLGNLGEKDYGRVWVAFEPNQIKAVQNRGTFIGSTDNIYKSTGIIASNGTANETQQGPTNRLPVSKAMCKPGQTQEKTSVGKEFRESDHPRGQPENAGEFATAGSPKNTLRTSEESGKPTAPNAQAPDSSVKQEAQPLSPPQLTSEYGKVQPTKGHLKEVVGKLGQSVWNRFPTKMQEGLAYTWAKAKWVEHKAMSGFRNSRELAGQLGQEWGLSEKSAKRLQNTLGFLDLVTAWTVNPAVGAVAGAAVGGPTGGILGAKAAAWTPVFSLGFIATSSLANPWMTIHAAKALVAKHKAALKKMLSNKDPRSMLAKSLSELDYTQIDWYLALLSQALDQSHGDLKASLQVADEVLSSYPDMMSTDNGMFVLEDSK